MQSGNEYETIDDLNKRNLIWDVDYAKFVSNKDAKSADETLNHIIKLNYQ